MQRDSAPDSYPAVRTLLAQIYAAAMADSPSHKPDPLPTPYVTDSGAGLPLSLHLAIAAED